MSRIATGTGDEGETSLFGGARVSKDHDRVAAYGDVDELNAHLGWAIEALDDDEARDALRTTQRDLFALGAELATEGTPRARIGQAQVRRLDAAIDALEAAQPELRSFVLPGGSEAAARLHVARSVCRRAERSLVRLGRDVEVSHAVRTYLNRLSDWLFLLARDAALASDAEVPMDFSAYETARD